MSCSENIWHLHPFKKVFVYCSRIMVCTSPENHPAGAHGHTNMYNHATLSDLTRFDHFLEGTSHLDRLRSRGENRICASFIWRRVVRCRSYSIWAESSFKRISMGGVANSSLVNGMLPNQPNVSRWMLNNEAFGQFIHQSAELNQHMVVIYLN